jgi:hypothetical protein
MCGGRILKIPPPHMIVSGHLQLNQINHFQILEPFELKIFGKVCKLQIGIKFKHYLK